MRSIIEIKSIDEALNHLGHHIELVFLDIDNTLIAAKDPVNIISYAEGLEQYIRTIYGPKHHLTVSQQEQIIDRYVSDYVRHMQPQLVEQSVLALIKSLRLRNTHIIALTGRTHDTATDSTQQLASCGIELSSHIFEPKEFQSSALDHPIIFQNGIISCGRNLKGKAACYFLQAINFKPSAVALIDDSSQYLDEMAVHLNNTGITFTGLRYGYLDSVVQQYVFSLEHLPKNLR